MNRATIASGTQVPESLHWRPLPLVAIVVTGLVLSAILFFQVRNWEQLQSRTKLDSLAAAHASALQKEFARLEEIVGSIANLRSASGRINHEAFHAFVAAVLMGHREIQALEWIPKVLHSERQQKEASARDSGQQDFRITERDADGQLIEAGERAEYFPVFFVEPLVGNEQALGYDVGSDPVRRAALENARDSGQTFLSERVKLVQDDDGQYGFLLFKPVYATGAVSATVEERRAQLVGFALCVFRIGPFIELALADSRLTGLDMWVFDTQAPTEESFIYFHPPLKQDQASFSETALKPSLYQDFYWETSLDVPERQWSLAFVPTSAFLDMHPLWRSWTILSAGLLLTLFVSAYSLRTQRYTKQIESRASALAQEKIEGEQRYRQLFEASNDAILLASLTNEFKLDRFLDANEVACRRLGYTHDELFQMSPYQILSPASAEQAPEYLRKLQDHGEVLFEAVHVAKDGTVIPVEQNVRLIQLDGQPVILATGRDLTERKRAERTLRDADANLSALFNVTTEAMLLVDKDAIILHLNDTAARVLGKPANELVGQCAYDFMPPDVARNRKARATEVVRSRKPANFIDQRGDRWLDNAVYPIFDDQGEVIRLAIFARNITKEKRANDLLAASERRYRRLYESSNDAIYLARITDQGLPGSFMDVNEIACRWLGYTREELLQLTPFDINDKEAAKKIQDHMQHILADGHLLFESAQVTKDGRKIDIELNVSLTELDGAPALLALGRNITERKRIERALQDSEARYRQLFEGSTDALFVMELNGRRIPNKFLDVNEEACKRLGYSREELLKLGPRDINPPNHEEQIVENVTRALEHGVCVFETTHVSKDGTTFPVEINLHPLQISGQPVFIANARDISERKHAEAQLAESEERFRQLAENIEEVFWITSADGNEMLYVSPAYNTIWGQSCESLYQNPRAWLTAIHPDDIERVSEQYKLIPARIFDQEYRVVRPDTSLVWIHDRAFPIRDESGNVLRVVGIAEDITLRKQAELNLMQVSESQMAKLSSVVEQTADAIMITDPNGVIEYINPAFEAITGYGRHEAVGKSSAMLKSGRHDNATYRELWATLLRGDVYRDVLINRRKDGALYYEEKTISPLKDSNGVIMHYISSGKDITERMQSEERVHHLAYHDVLTNLPNRAMFMERINHATTQRINTGRRIAVLFMDLDRFKIINDTLGHAIGDNLLKAIPERLLTCVREGDTVARFGGDEFAILLENISSFDIVSQIATKLIESLERPYRVGDQELYITTSIGISLYPDDSRDASTLIKNADTAMYRAKDLGRNNYQFYSADMSARAFERLSLETSLRRALERSEFLLYFQPQVDLLSGEIIGAETLIRWQHPDLGIVSPIKFVPLLEDTGLIVPVGEWVLRSACTHARQWQSTRAQPFKISVNFSLRQFHDPLLAAQLSNILHETGLPPHSLEVEITESVVMQNEQTTSDNLNALKDAGIRFSIDDFGTGYSSLSYLKRFPVDALKIDRTFISDVTTDPEDAAIVTAIIAMAHSLNLGVVAEGVETKEQLAFLREKACNTIQGFLFSAPVPADEFTRLLQDRGDALHIAK